LYFAQNNKQIKRGITAYGRQLRAMCRQKPTRKQRCQLLSKQALSKWTSLTTYCHCSCVLHRHPTAHSVWPKSEISLLVDYVCIYYAISIYLLHEYGKKLGLDMRQEDQSRQSNMANFKTQSLEVYH